MISRSRVKYIQSLNEKKFRKQDGVFIAEGPKIIKDLLVSDNIKTLALYAVEDWWRLHGTLPDSLPAAECLILTEKELERISFLSTPNYVLGIFSQPHFSEEPAGNEQLSLLLDGIQDPGNMGTIIRIADWFGIKQIVASLDSVDNYNPKVVQSTMGSIARVHVMYADLLDYIRMKDPLPVYATTLHGKPLSAYGKIREGMLLVGNESKGIREDLLAVAKYEITIPKSGFAQSLNAAVATGIVLSHVV